MNVQAPLNQLPERWPATLRTQLHLKQSLRPARRKHPLEEPVQRQNRLWQLSCRIMAVWSDPKGLRNEITSAQRLGLKPARSVRRVAGQIRNA